MSRVPTSGALLAGDLRTGIAATAALRPGGLADGFFAAAGFFFAAPGFFFAATGFFLAAGFLADFAGVGFFFAAAMNLITLLKGAGH